jgi:transposase InsO family protein
MDKKTREEVALFRVAVLGPLVGARLEHGDLVAYCREAASRSWEWPGGDVVALSARTIEDWHYQYQSGGFEALFPQQRSDFKESRAIPKELGELILRLKQEKPRRSVKRIIRILERAKKASRGELTKSSVHRLLKAHGASKRPARGPGAERRSFLHECAGELLVGDALHVHHLVLDRQGRPCKACLLSQIDGATRYVPHSYFAFGPRKGEDAVDQEYGLKQVLLSFGLWRIYYVDRGPAYTALSLRAICAELDIRLLHTQTKDAEAKGVIERWHRTWREEVEDELPLGPIPIDELIAKHDAWLSVEYHARKHDTTGRVPREHWLEQVDNLRPIPPGKSLDEVFLHRVHRDVRKDGTVRFEGRFLEVRAELAGERDVELRFDPSRPDLLPKVYVDDSFVCDTVPLDRYANAQRHRRQLVGAPVARVEPTGLDPLALMQREHELHTRPLSGALSPEDTDETDDDSTEA